MKKSKHIAGAIIFGVIYTVAIILLVGCRYINNTLGIGFTELIFTLSSPIKGTSPDIILTILKTCLPPVILSVLVYVAVAFMLCQNKVMLNIKLAFKKRITNIDGMKLLRRIGALLCVVLLVFASWFVDTSLGVIDFIKALTQQSTLYEDYYVDPMTVDIECEGKPKNLIYIFVESLETSYASYDVGGFHDINYIPNLTDMASENLSFSDRDGLGGFLAPFRASWTMAAMMAATSGVPFQFPVELNGMESRENVAEGLSAIGNILDEKGYQQEFLCGSDGEFSGRKRYFEQHGNYYVLDYYEAINRGYIPEDYHVWWGFEDKKLYKIAQDELLRLADSDKPFNLTMLTVDTHYMHGYICDECENIYEPQLANVVACTDRQLAEFVSWCQQQDFYDDTTIIITGDHPRMDTDMVEGIDWKDRFVYNCFINTAQDESTVNKKRVFTTMDMFPTTLAAMGFDIDGDKLGLGTNLFSDKPTLAEDIGYDTLDAETSKYSSYYIKNFS